MIPAQGVGAFVRENAPFLLAGATICFLSSFGQTFFISLFAGEIMEAFALSDGDWGLLYALATLVSAGAMIGAGVLVDRMRVRRLLVFVGIGLAGACLAMAASTGPVMLVFVIFALRFLGQGMMSHLPAVAMSRWFIASRGKALAISALGFAVGQAILPVIFVAAGEVVAWRWLWVVSAVIVVAVLPLVVRLLRHERTPQSIAAETPAPGLDNRHWTRGDILRNPLFWAMGPLLLGPPAFGTALFFHQVHLVAEKGWALVDYVALMPLFTAVSMATMLGSGLLIDRFGSARLMMGFLVPFALGFVVLAQAQTLWGAALALAIFGLGTGAQGTLPTACWAELCGTRHLGAIKALAVAVMVLGSAVGPGLTGVAIDLGWSFPEQMVAIAIYFLAAQALAAVALARALPRLAGPAQVDVVRP